MRFVKSVYIKLRSFSLKQAMLLTIALAIASVLVGAVVIADRLLLALSAAASFLYVVMLSVLTLRQLEYRLSTEKLEAIAKGQRGFASAASARTAQQSQSGIIVRPAWGAVGFYAELNAKKSRYLAKQLVRSRYEDGRDILAHIISKGKLDIGQLRDLLDAYRAPIKKKAVVIQAAKFNGDALREMARVLYRQDFSTADRLDAASCYELLFDVHGARSFSQHDIDWLLASLLAIGRVDRFEEWAERFGLAAEGSINYSYLKANSINPWTIGRGEDIDGWNERVGDIYRASTVPAARVAATEGEAFSRLQAGDLGPAGGALVTVVMPVFNPGPEVEWSVRSIIHQSWKTLEIIVVDDGSTQGLEILARLPMLDSRIRVERLPQNRGAYAARNEGLRLARGDLVTCHDSDDWAHPMRVELQARDLLDRPDAVANISSLCRVDRNLLFKNRNSISNPNFVYPAFVTLMFRRLPVVEALGGWDEVRKAGDSEFISRIKLVFGQDLSVVEPKTPLTFALLDANSLSGSDLFRGYLHPERKLYQTRYMEWHADIAEGLASPKISLEGQRPFEAPASFLPERITKSYDVVFVSELGFTGGNANSLLHEIQICLDAGLRVAIARARNLLFVGIVAEREPIEPIRRLIRSGRIEEITLATACEADLVIVRWPACFQYLPKLAFGIKAKRSIVVANHVPYETGNVRHFYDLQRVLTNVGAAFGANPIWAPQSAVIRELCAPHLAGEQLLDFDWVGVLESSSVELVERSQAASSGPVIGRHSRDDHLKWPETRSAILDAYPTSGCFEVRVMGGITKLLSQGLVAAEEVAEWKLFEFNELPPREFLKTIDFFVYFPHRDLVEAFGRVVMEALASGAVVIVPRHFEEIFGDACVYADPSQVQPIVTSFYQDWDSYLRQSRTGQDYIRRNCTPEAYLRRLERLGVAPPAG